MSADVINILGHEPPEHTAKIDTASLLTEISSFIQRFVVLPSDSALTAVALFVLHSYALDAAAATPYLLASSPERQSGKTRLLEVAELLVRCPWRVASASEAAMFRKIEQDSPTLLLDEIDVVFTSSSERAEGLRGLLNAGNRRGASVARVVGKGKEMNVVDFNVFGAKMLAGIDCSKLPETITDRAISIKMQRRREGEPVERFRYRYAERDAKPIKTALGQWAKTAVSELQEVEPHLPDELSDRQADAWEPLFAIADRAGRGWPARARAAAIALSDTTGDELGRGAQLLGAIRAAMDDRSVIGTAELLAHINADEELPFGGWGTDGLDGRGLARLLKPYGVKPRTVRIGDATVKGYAKNDLADVFSRYLPDASQASHPSQDPESGAENPHSQADVTDVTDVTLFTRGSGREGSADDFVAQATGARGEADRARADAGASHEP
jgi:Protein of unknown function (DUF3631)